MAEEQPQTNTVAIAECLMCGFTVYLNEVDIDLLLQTPTGYDRIFSRFHALPPPWCGDCDTYFHVKERYKQHV